MSPTPQHSRANSSFCERYVHSSAASHPATASYWTRPPQPNAAQRRDSSSLATRPEPDRWLSLALIVESSPTMVVWRSLVDELMELLQRSASFSDIRLWHLHTTPDGTAGLHPQAVPTGNLHSPREILDPTGRQTVWCISDCASPLWRDGRADRLLELWGRSGPLAIIQPLPQRLWRRSGLRPEHVRLHTSTPGAPNSLLRVTSTDSSAFLREPVRGLPVPVLELESSWLTPWTRLVTATAPGGVPAVVTMTRPLRCHLTSQGQMKAASHHRQTSPPTL